MTDFESCGKRVFVPTSNFTADAGNTIKKPPDKNQAVFLMAGLAGFEPTNDGIKNRCLTTWRQPNRLFLWRAWRDSNSRPLPSEGNTLSS